MALYCMCPFLPNVYFSIILHIQIRIWQGSVYTYSLPSAIFVVV